MFADAKKDGCHEIAVGNPKVIDVEIALPGKYVFEGEETAVPRVDLAAAETYGADARLRVLGEKIYDNGELRTKSEKVTAPVCAQVARYRTILMQHRDGVESQLHQGRCKPRCVQGDEMDPPAILAHPGGRQG